MARALMRFFGRHRSAEDFSLGTIIFDVLLARWTVDVKNQYGLALDLYEALILPIRYGKCE